MKQFFAVALLFAVILSAFAGPVAAKPADKVFVCHVDEQGRTKSIEVSANALSAHEAHGDYTFAGLWNFQESTLLDVATITRSGNSITGVWLAYNRPVFSGSLVDGCVVDMTFPDDATYRGTLVGPCKIQWSVRNNLETVDPNNYWVKADCPA